MIYYIETNLIAIIISVLMLIQARRTESKNETSYIILSLMMWMSVFLSACDIMAYCYRGKNYLGVEISNMMYFVSMLIGCYLWFLYICIKMHFAKQLRKTILLTSPPAIITLVAILTNPVTEYIFSVDSDVAYRRADGIVLTWVVEWGYIFAALVLNIVQIAKSQSKFRKKKYAGYLLFLIPMIIAGACQMMFYGVTIIQIGVVIAVLLIYSNKQYYQIQRDELTELDNKNSFLHFKDKITSESKNYNATILFIDVDNFKQINDKYGHLIGDMSLKDIGVAIKTACSSVSRGFTPFRYAGDEFVIVGLETDNENLELLKSKIDANLKEKNEINKKNGEKYTLSVSIGCAEGLLFDDVSFEKLFIEADKDMYRVKKDKKSS